MKRWAVTLAWIIVAAQLVSMALLIYVTNWSSWTEAPVAIATGLAHLLLAAWIVHGIRTRDFEA